MYSKKLIQFAINNKIKILYASSASIYGLNANNQKESSLKHKPINYYAKSKFLVDKFTKNKKLFQLSIFILYIATVIRMAKAERNMSNMKISGFCRQVCNSAKIYLILKNFFFFF